MRPPAAQSWWMLDVSVCPSSVPSIGEQSLCSGLPLHLLLCVDGGATTYSVPRLSVSLLPTSKAHSHLFVPSSRLDASHHQHFYVFSAHTLQGCSHRSSPAAPSNATSVQFNVSVFKMFSPLVQCVVCKVNAPALINICS